MPLPPAAPRKNMHTRDIQCCGYERADGLWDIEGHLVDTKSFPARHRPRAPGGRTDPQHVAASDG